MHAPRIADVVRDVLTFVLVTAQRWPVIAVMDVINVVRVNLKKIVGRIVKIHLKNAPHVVIESALAAGEHIHLEKDVCAETLKGKN